MERNCRMCLAEDLKKSFQIFSYTLEDNLSVYDFYTNFTSINLRNQDERTKSKICLTCLKKLLTFYNDKCQAIANNEIISKWRDEAIDPFAGPQDPSELVKIESQLLSIEIIVNPLDECSNIEKVKIEEELFDFGEASAVIPKFKDLKSEPAPATVHNEAAHTKRTKSYPCTYCDKVFKRAVLLNLHIKCTHLKIRKHVCPNCGLEFSSRSGLKEHMSKYLEKRFICDSCGLRFNSKNKLRYHFKAKHFGVKLEKIELIGADNREIGKEPIRVAQVERREAIEVKSSRRGRPKKTRFTINPKPIQHSTVEPTENGVTPNRKLSLKKPAKKLVYLVICQTCGITTRSDVLKKHIETVHEKIKRYFCDACPRGFYQQHQLKVHTMVHEGDPTVPCTFENCMKMFYTKNLLASHVTNCHTENKDDYPCSYPECSKSFRTANQVKDHINHAHLKIRDHVCPYCKNRFTTKQVLKQHVIAKHEGNKFICDRCGKSYSSKVKVGAHFRQAHWDPPLACSFCGKKYKRYQNLLLRNHELNHQNIRNHPCEICSKPFKTNVFKMEHIRAVHFKSKIKCELCGRSFPRPGYYKVHVKEKHEDLGAERTEEWLARIENIRADYDKLEWVYD